MEEIMNYLPVKRTAIEELKWLEMQDKVNKLKESMGDKWLLAKPVEKLNG